MDNQKKFEARRAVGRRVSLMRKTLGLSVSELAEQAGIPRQYVYDLEGGIRVSVTNVFAVAKAMRVSTDYILGLAEEPFYQSVTHGCCHVAARVDAFNRLRGVAYYKTADGSMMPGERGQFVDSDILSVLTDHWVVREQDAVPGRPPGQQIGVVEQCPTLSTPGHVTADIAFDFKATNGGLTGITLVTYVEDTLGQWHIVSGADPTSGEFDSTILKSLAGNSRALPNDKVVFVTVEDDIPPGVDALRMVTLVAQTGTLSPTGGKAESRPTDDELRELGDLGRVVHCQ